MDSDRVEGRMGDANGDAEFERALQAALRRVDAPEGFASRVLAQAAQRDARQSGLRGRLGAGRFAAPSWRLLYAAAALIAITAGTVRVERVRVERQRSEAAAAQFSEAMDVTNRTLGKVSERLQQGEVGQFTKVLGSDR